MLGVFDSGFGGLTVLKPIHERLPTLSTVYLGDNARAPYGIQSQEDILQFTLEGVRFLFDQGCPLVVLACNTASVKALRRIQQEVLPSKYPNRRVLGVVRPAAEYIAKHATRVGLFATPATVESAAYIHEFYNLNPTMKATQVACPELTNLIEAGKQDSRAADELVAGCVKELLTRDNQIQEILLACTHYPIVESVFRAYLPQTIHVLNQGKIVTASLESYLTRHPELDEQLQRTSKRKYFTTNGSNVSGLASMFYGEEIQFEKVVIA